MFSRGSLYQLVHLPKFGLFGINITVNTLMFGIHLFPHSNFTTTAKITLSKNFFFCNSFLCFFFWIRKFLIIMLKLLMML